MNRNRSFIFFQRTSQENPDLGPVAAAGVALTPGRSLAVDHRLHTFGTPVFVATHEPLPQQAARFRRLMLAQDTGSAIIGPARGDLFIGSGREAGTLAGGIKHRADFTVLVPRKQGLQR
jgi:membrane-bound lytic murein transglycosylase A